MNSDNTMQSMTIPGASNFRFSAVRPANLGATEYTLATIVVDTTGSVTSFTAELKKAVVAVIESLRKSPRADNLLVRLVTFNKTVTEVFGFKALGDIDTSTIADFSADGLTALFDATFEALGAAEQYASVLYDQDFDTNGGIYVITDGGDNASRQATAASVARKVEEIRQGERMESLFTMLVGVNTGNAEVKRILARFAQEGKFDQYLDVGEANAGTLAKLAGFVSKSISSQSQALGSGGPSRNLTF